jgi:DNA-binding LacI/PurR family transcriptional regulator
MIPQRISFISIASPYLLFYWTQLIPVRGKNTTIKNILISCSRILGLPVVIWSVEIDFCDSGVFSIQKGKKITIYDIATYTGISPSTVSRVLSSSNYPVSGELREKVLAAAKEMDYHPNLIARNLKKNNSRNIGIVLPSISNPFYPSLVRGVEDVAYSRDYTFSICSCDNEMGKEKTYLTQLIENNVSGIITFFLPPVEDTLRSYVDRGGTVLLVHSEENIIRDFHNFWFDYRRQAFDATQHLTSLGHHRIALLIAPLTNSIRQLKYEGYQLALSAASVAFNPAFVHMLNPDEIKKRIDNETESQAGYELTRRMLQQTPEVTGIICMNDMMALGCISCLSDHGYKVPDDYSVVSFDDIFFASLISPKITTVRMEKYKLGQYAMDTMIDLVENGGEVRKLDLSSYAYLVVRESTARPR